MAFCCGKCDLALTVKPNLESIPLAASRITEEVLEFEVFTHCGHPFHLGCLCETWFQLQAENKPSVCPTCSAPCDSYDLTRMYPVLQQELLALPKNKKQSIKSSNKLTEASSLYSPIHTLVAFTLWALTIQLCYYQLRIIADKSLDDLEDEDISDYEESPTLRFFLTQAIGVLLSGLISLSFDIYKA